jgi:hypothetical protein
LGGEGGEVVEGEDPILAGESAEVAEGGGDGGEGRRAGIDEGSEDAGGEGFAGAGRSLEDEDGEGAIGAEGGEEPGEAAEPIGAGGKIEKGAESFEGAGGRGGGGRGNGAGGAGGLEESVGAGGGGPASGRDFDKLTLGIGEVEEDLGGRDAVGITASDAMPDGEALVLVFVVGLGFEVIEDRVESAGAREGVVLGVELMEEPLAVGAGADGEDVETVK